MAVIPSGGQLYSFDSRRRGVSQGDLTRDNATYAPPWGYANDYALIYATQPAVRACVDFLGRNVAQIGFHWFRRLSDTDRERLAPKTFGPALWTEQPNPYTTRYRLFESVMSDMALYMMAFWLKQRDADGRVRLLRLPPPEMRVEGGLLPTGYVWMVGGRTVPLATSDVVYFNGYNPLHTLAGLSPIETLRQTLLEDLAATQQRTAFWRNGSRMDGVIERPREAPRWTPLQKQQWREQWQQRHTGPSSVGSVAVLEDGMTYKQVTATYRDSEYTAARKLTLEEVIRQYQIPPPMVGDLDHATFSNIKEQRKQLYTECLGPYLKNIEEAIELQLLSEVADDTTDIYGEFNIAEKLKGAFEEQTNALRVAVGRPFMTANEARARLNLPAIADDPSANELASQQGAAVTGDPFPATQNDKQAAVAQVVRATLDRQATRLARFPVAARPDLLNYDRCAAELAADLTPILGDEDAQAYAVRITDHTYQLLVEGRDAFGAGREVPHVA